MFSRLDPSARALLTLAEQECRNAGHYYVGTEHLLLAMAIAPSDDVADDFAASGIQPWEVKEALRATMDPVTDHPWDGVLLTPRTQRVLAVALQAAAPGPVTPRHLLQAILDDGGGVAARVLRRLMAQRAAARSGA
jgi:ATP-dependent Clp protease ATP-binding subunit ClpA